MNTAVLMEKAEDFALAFAYLTALVAHYAPPEDKEVQAFLGKAKQLSREVLGNAKSSTNGRESASNCLRAA